MINVQTLGFWVSRGQFLLFVDADGATKFGDLSKLYEEMKILKIADSIAPDNVSVEHEPAVVVGSRAHMEKESIVKR